MNKLILLFLLVPCLCFAEVDEPRTDNMSLDFYELGGKQIPDYELINKGEKPKEDKGVDISFHSLGLIFKYCNDAFVEVINYSFLSMILAGLNTLLCIVILFKLRRK